MEQKSIGGFIAALCKVHGMTQKDLAERINVSDKTVSRWERGDGLPDLSMIPVLAELFDVTCDELLCGERKQVAPEQDSARKQKQIKRLLDSTLHRFQYQSYMVLVLLATGVLIAFCINYVALRALLGLFIGLIFIFIAVALQVFFLNSSHYALEQEEFELEQLRPYRQQQFAINQRLVQAAGYSVSLILPFLLVNGSHYGMSFGWAQLLFVPIWWFLYYFVIKGICFTRAVKVEVFAESANTIKRRRIFQIKKQTIALLIGLCCVPLIGQCYLEAFGVSSFAQGEYFTDPNEFADYMSQDLKRDEDQTGQSDLQADENLGATYFDEDGNEISEDEFRYKELTDQDGNVIVSYYDRNEQVVSTTISYINGQLESMTAYTDDHWDEARVQYDYYSNLLAWGYLWMFLLAMAVYGIRRINIKL